MQIDGLAATFVAGKGKAAPTACHHRRLGARPIATATACSASGPTRTSCWPRRWPGAASPRVRYDKRGVGGKRGRRRPGAEELRITHMADDVVTVARLAARQTGHHTRRLLMGHSEGGLLALLAAARVKPGGDRTAGNARPQLGTILREQFSRPGTHPAICRRSVAHRGRARAWRGRCRASVRHLQAAFRPSVQPYLRSLMAIDPAALAAKTSQPMLSWAGGGTSRSARATSTGSWPRARTRWAYWEPGMGAHVEGRRAHRAVACSGPIPIRAWHVVDGTWPSASPTSSWSGSGDLRPLLIRIIYIMENITG